MGEKGYLEEHAFAHLGSAERTNTKTGLKKRCFPRAHFHPWVKRAAGSLSLLDAGLATGH